MANVGVVGLGYIGLPTCGLLAAKGFKILGIDIQSRIVETINSGRIHIHENGLEDLIRSAVENGNLRATTKAEPCEIFMIAVPTPFKENFAPDLSYVESAMELIAPVIKAGDMVILESTVPVGATERIEEILLKAKPELKGKVDFAHCPERVLPGNILNELVSNARVVGGLTPRATERACAFYRKFVKGEVVPTDARTAELCKLSENAFRDVNIAFANELSMVCEKLGIDVWELIALANRHPRVKILHPGPGVGGHCIPVDPWFIVSSAPKEAELIRTARNVNTNKTRRVIEQIRRAGAKSPGQPIACLGLAFKADVDDFRESPAMEIVEVLAHTYSGPIKVVEPYTKELPSALRAFSNIELVTLADALKTCAVVALLVDHKEFKALTPSDLNEKTVLDTRGVWREQLTSRSVKSAS